MFAEGRVRIEPRQEGESYYDYVARIRESAVLTAATALVASIQEAQEVLGLGPGVGVLEERVVGLRLGVFFADRGLP